MKEIKYLFIVNPIAGGNDKKPFIDFVKSENEKEAFSHIIYQTTGEKDEQEIKKLAKKHIIDIAVAVGGDGTLLMVAKIFKNSETKIGLIPTGSANGMSRELQIPKESDVINFLTASRFSEAWKIIRTENVKDLDMVQINKKHFSLHLSDIGLNAQIVKRFEAEKVRGYFGYAKQFFKELRQTKKIHYRIETDGQQYQGHAYMIVIANAQMYGTGSVINPEGKYDDGQFELCIIRNIRLKGLFKALLSIFKKDVQYQKQDLKIISCKSATISLKQTQTLQVDGEVIGEVKKIQAEIEPGCVKMLV